MLSRLLTLSRQSLIYGLGSVVSRFVAIIFTPIYTRLLHTAGYGDLGLLTTGAALLTILLTLGLDSATLFYYYREDSAAGKRAILSTWLTFVVGLSLITCLLVWWLAQPVSTLLLHRTLPALVRLALLAVPPSLALAIMLETLRVNMKPVRYATLSVANLLLTVGLNVVFVVVLHKGVPGILVANALGMACIVLFGLILTRGYYALTFSVTWLRALLRYGVPLVPAGASYWAINLAGNVILNYARNNSTVGVYQGATKLSQVITLATAAFIAAWGPFAYSLASHDDAKRTYATVLTYYMTTMCGLALLLSLFSREVLTVFTTDAFVPGYQIVGLLALASISYGAYSIVSIGAGLAEKTIHIGWVTVVAAALTILSNVFLARYFGIFGTAASTLLGNVTATYLLYRISQRYYPIPYDQWRILAVVALTCLVGLAGIYCDRVLALGMVLALLKIGLALAYIAVTVLAILHPADVAAARAIFRRARMAREASR